MWSYAYKHFKGKRITALVIMISMVLPMISMAQAPQKPVLLSDEQEFLNQFEENIQAILDHPDWHVDGDDLVLELNKNKNGKQRRFLLNGFKGSKEKLELFVQEKVLGKKVFERPGYKRWILDPSKDGWEYLYKKLPLGLANYSKSPTGYTAYVTSETLEEYLSTNKITYQTDDGKVYDESGKFSLTPAGLEKQKRKEADDRYTTAVMQCSAVVENDDIKDRKLMTKVFSMDKVPHTFSQAELDAYEDQIEIGKLEKNSLENLSHRVLDISLHATITTWLAFYEIFNGKKTKDQWLQYFNNADYFSKFFIELPQFKNSIPKLIDKYVAAVQKNPFHLLSEEELKLAISSFNYQVKNINQSCKNAREELLRNIDVAPNKPVFSSQGMAQFADKMEREISEKYTPLVDPFFQKIKSSQLSILFGSEDFRDDIGQFDISDCVTDAEGINETNLEKVNDAIADIEKMYRTKLAGIILGYNDAFKASLVQNYIKSLPISVQLALNQKKSAHEVKVVCGLIDDIYEDDYFSKKVDQGLLGIGIIAAAVCGYAELGIPATFVAMSPINAAVVLRGRDKWNEGVTLENQVSQALITGEMSHDMAMEDIKKHEDRQTEGLWDFFGTIGGESVGYVGGYVVKQGVRQGSRVIRYIKDSKTRTALNFFEARDAAALRDIQKLLDQSKYIPLDPKNKEKAIQILHEVAMTGNTYEQTKNVFAHSFARQNAIKNAQSQLQLLGFTEADAKSMLDRLFDLENGALRQRLNLSHTVRPDGTYTDRYGNVIERPELKPQITDKINTDGPLGTTGTDNIVAASASTGRPGIPSGRGRFVQNDDGQWVRLAKSEIVPAHAIQIKSLKEQEELLWRKVGKVDQHIEEIEQIKDIGDIPVEIEETMKELQRERIHLEYEIKTINSYLVHRVKDLLEKYGIKSSLVKSDGMESLLINLKTDHPIHETVRKYLSRVTDEPLGYFSYEYNPFKLRQMMAGGAILNGNNFVMGMHTIERLVTNNLDSLEFHEIRHLFHAIRRKNQIPSIWDQRFKSPTDDLISIETYSKEYGVEEFDSYADEFKRASRELYWSTKETPRNIPRMLEGLADLENHRFTLNQFSESSMKHSKEFYEAILHERYRDYFLDDDLKSITIRLRNDKAYVKYFVSEDEIKLFDQLKEARVMPDSPNFIFAQQRTLNYLLGQLKELNRLSYLQTIDLLRIEHEFTQIRAILDHGDLSEPALNQLQAHIDKSMGLSQKTWFRDYQNEKAYGLTIQKAPESYFNDLWNDVIQDDQQVHAISIHLSQVFLEPTVAIHPKLLNLNIGEGSIEIQKVLDKAEYRMLDPDKAIDILDDAKTSENYIQGKIDLRAMGYLEEDASAMIKKIEGRSSDHTQHFASSVPLDLKDHSSAYKGFLEKIPSIKLTGNHFDELVEVAEKENIYVSQGVAGIVVRSSPSAVVKFTHSAQDLKRQIKAYNILKKNGYRVPLQLSKIRTIRNNYGQTIARVEFENINGISIAEIRTSRYRILGGSTDDIDQSVVGFSVVLEYEIALLTSLLKKNSLKFDDMRFYEDIIFTGEIDDLQRIGTRYYAKTISKKEVRDYLIQNLVWLDPVY